MVTVLMRGLIYLTLVAVVGVTALLTETIQLVLGPTVLLLWKQAVEI